MKTNPWLFSKDWDMTVAYTMKIEYITLIIEKNTGCTVNKEGMPQT